MSDFIKAAEAAEEQAQKSLDMDKALELANELGALQASAKVSFIDLDEMRKIRFFIDTLYGGPPPLKLLEDLLDLYKAREHQLELEEIPKLLQEAGVKAVKFPDGRSMEIKPRVAATLVDDAKFQAWAEAHGLADLLKVKFQLRKGEPLDKVRAALKALGANFTEGLDKSGLPQALAKMAKDRLEEGLDLPPPDALDVRSFEVAVLK